MDDLISRQQAIDALYNVDEYNSRSVTAIKNLPSIQSEQRWIPVTERLPEKRGFYLVTEKEYRIGDKNHLGKFKTKVNFVEFEKKWNRANFFEITAWMPLPKPYHRSEVNMRGEKYD